MASATVSEQQAIDWGDDVDVPTFEQILEMDESEDDHEFSSSIVFDFLQQAESTLTKMQALIKEEKLDDLSSAGHFLKGSSATLGFVLIRDACEKIQNLGHLKKADGSGEIEETEALLQIRQSVSEAKVAYQRVSGLMHTFYGKSE